jgi:opacity protein-like surface antigen
VSEYVGDPAETARAFRNGWFYSGDIGSITKENLLIITGRQKTVLNIGGDKVKPEIIEGVLTSFKGINEAGAVGFVNEYGLEEVWAMIVSASEIDTAALHIYCQSRLPPTFVPRRFVRADSLPKNEMGIDTDIPASPTRGGTIGGQIGLNWQDDAFVYGIEGDFNWASARASENITNPCINCGPGGTPGIGIVESKMQWLSTIRGRAGITVGVRQGTLLYVTGGLAIAGIKSHWGLGYATGGAQAFNPDSFVSDNTKIGWTAGLGIEHMLAGTRWSFKAEALWIEFRNDNVTVPGPSTFNLHPGPFPSQFQNQAALARLGLNYRY